MVTASPVSDGRQPVKRSRSYEWLPPYMSELRVVLLGNSWSERSSVGNVILGENVFNTEEEPDRCLRERGELKEKEVVLINTPDLLLPGISEDKLRKHVETCESLSDPGPHVFLLVIRIGRFTAEEKETLKLIKEGFGKNAEKFTIILLTGGDSLEQDEISIEEYINKKCDDSFKKLIADCGGRYHVFNNYDKHNRTQVSELITKIDAMVKTNGGSWYSNERLQEAEAAIKKEMEKILKEKEEEMKREREELERKHEEEMETMKRRMEEQRAEIEKERET